MILRLNKLKERVTRKHFAVIVGICISAVMISLFVVLQRSSFSLPANILQLRLNEEIRGEDAREIVNKMHSKSVTPDENAIGVYVSSNGSATLYLSHYNSSDAAVEQFERMARLVRDGQGTVFSRFRKVQIQRKEIYLCLGLGQVHYFFLAGSDLYWLAIDPPIAQATLQELVRIVHTAE